MSVADKAMWEEMQSSWDLFVLEIEKAEHSFGVSSEVNNEIDDNLIRNELVDYTGRDKQVLTTSRRGQEFFRRSVLSAYDYKCCISGLSVPKLLVASHIIPWKDDEKNRLNPRNGLCLSSLHDKAFDKGIIAITENMRVSVSQLRASKADPFFDSAILAYDGKPILLPEKFPPNKEFLSYHRQNIFESR